MERRPYRSQALSDPHIGLGKAGAVDIRVRFPSGIVRDVLGAKAKSTVVVREEEGGGK